MNLILNRAIPWISAVLILIGLEILLAQPQWFLYLTIALVIIIFISLWQLTGRNLKTVNFRNFLITPIFLLLGGIAILLFFNLPLWRQVTVIVLSSAYILLFSNINLYLYRPADYQPYSLGNILSYLNLAAIFLVISSLNNFAIFLAWPFWLLLLFALLVIFLLNHEIHWIRKVTWSEAWLFIVVNTLLVLEFFALTYFWPTSNYVKALVVTLIYYLLNGISTDYLLPSVEKKVIKRYLFFVIVILIIILLTSRWS